MRRHRPTYTFEPYERVPDGQGVKAPQLAGWRLYAARATFVAFLVLIPLMIVLSAILS